MVLLFLVNLLAGCIIYPMQVVTPLETTVVDAKTGIPIEGAQVLRVVCDIHDYGCNRGKIDIGQTNKEGEIEISGKRQWGIWILGPGGLPVPNHQIAIWKDGYYVFVFSQYGNNIDRFKRRLQSQGGNSQMIMDAINEIPQERKYIKNNRKASSMLTGGKVLLYTIGDDSKP